MPKYCQKNLISDFTSMVNKITFVFEIVTESKLKSDSVQKYHDSNSLTKLFFAK